MSDPAAPLGALIDEQIRTDGPMSIATYMALCLNHPTLGYYRTRDPLGQGGDFITAPEISQMFGEIVGAFVASAWQALGRPNRFDLVELGPGRGTLMADMLRVTSGVQGAKSGLRPVLVETSETLIAAQRQRLADREPTWVGSIDELEPEGPPLVVIANEFFDALPITQLQKTDTGWHERLVGLIDGERRFGLAPGSLPAAAVPSVIEASETGAIWENGRAARGAMTVLAERLVARTGVALIIDYGYGATRTGDTFQAVANHRHTDPLARPGEADLTAHVDFEALAEAAREAGAVPRELLTQAQFLAAMGILARARSLASANPAIADSVTADLRRLTSGAEMGTLFKVLCLTSPGLAPYPFGAT